jgi:hypothetical protein
MGYNTEYSRRNLNPGDISLPAIGDPVQPMFTMPKNHSSIPYALEATIGR